MADLLNLTPSQREDFRVFLMGNWQTADLEAICGAWASAMIPEDLIAGLQSFGNDLGAEPEIVIRVLVTLRLLGIQADLFADEIIEGVAESISDEEWPTEVKSRWPESEAAFRRLLSDPAVRRVAMVVNLSYEYSHLLQTARIITDVRPIFDEGLSTIEGAVVAHTLRLRYDSAGGDQTISLAMDDIDVRRLREQCERAIRKAEIATNAISSSTGMPIFISGQASVTRTKKS